MEKWELMQQEFSVDLINHGKKLIEGLGLRLEIKMSKHKKSIPQIFKTLKTCQLLSLLGQFSQPTGKKTNSHL